MAKRRIKGEGSIYYDAKNDRWIGQVTLPNGKRRSKTGQKNVVLKWINEQKTQISKGVFVENEKIKLGDYLEDYIQGTENNLRPRTYQRHLSLIRNHIIPELGNIRLVALQPDHIQRFYSLKRKEGLSARTVQYIHSVLNKALKQALKWGLIIRNPADLVEKPKVKKITFQTWNKDEIIRFLEAVKDHRWYLVYLLAIYTGMRQSEILGLHVEDINIDKGVIHVRHQLQAIPGVGFVISTPKTKKSIRPITISETLQSYLKEYLKNLNRQSGLLFTTSTGNPISARNLYRHYKKVIEKEGLPSIRFHDLRHTHATLLLTAGVHPKVVQERLGHASIVLTLDTYSHVVPSLQSEAAKQFEEALN